MWHERHSEPLSRRQFSRLAVAAGFVTGADARWLFADVERRLVTGVVAAAGQPLSGVRVSDGRRVTATDDDGRYAIEVGPGSGPFVFVTTPRGFWTDRFHVPTARAARRGQVDFRLVLRSQPDPFRFVFMTDMHVEGGGFRVEKLRRTMTEIRDLGPAFVWAQGDISLQGNAAEAYLSCCSELVRPDAAVNERPGPNSQRRPATLRASAGPAAEEYPRDELASSSDDRRTAAEERPREGLAVARAHRGIPIRNGAGNHEMILDASDPRGQYHALFGPTYYSFDWGGVHCIVLDGNQVVSREKHWRSVRGALSEREFSWLAADLAAKPPGMPVIVGIHIPLVSSYSERRGHTGANHPAWIVEDAQRIHTLLAAHDTRLVLQGHLHENERVLLGSVEYVESQAVSGSWWQSGDGFERGVDGAPRGYRIVEVDGGKITHRFQSSCESRLEGPGQIVGARGELRRRRTTHFIYNCFDAPRGARSRGRIDQGPWRNMMPHPSMNPRLSLIQPHHFRLDVDTLALAPGRHAMDVETVLGGEVFRHRSEFTLRAAEARPVPVIYSTDLYHPHEDPDDHFDLAALLAMKDIDLRAVILDDGARQKKHPGRVAVEQLTKITGRTVPVAAGLAPRLRAPDDAAREQPREFQAGVKLILKVLRESEEPVTIVTAGSLRDVAAARNREPELCARKIDRLYAFIGDAHSAPDFPFREYNVTLDVSAYVSILRSGLTVYWVPCFDGGVWQNRGRASFWKASHRDLLARVADPVKQYFIYALLRKSEPRGIDFIDRPVVAAEWEQVLVGERNLWCCAVFSHISDRPIVRHRSAWRSVPRMAPHAGDIVEPFRFERVLVNVDSTGMVHYPDRLPHYAVERFRITNRDDYADIMTAVTADLLRQLG